MGLVQDQRPRDWAYKAIFKEKDLPSLQEMARHIRETHDVKMIEDFNAKCEQKLAGDTAILDNGLEIQAVTKTGDLVLNPGLQLCIDIIRGASAARYSHFGMAIGNTPAPAVTDTALTGETIAARVILSWGEAVGMRMYFGGISRQTTPEAPSNVGEIGVYNSAIAGAVLLNRSSWATTIGGIAQQTPTITGGFSAVIVVSCVIEFCPVA